MKWLFWKEYRQNRMIVIAMLVFLIVPYLFGLFAVWKWALAAPREMLRYDYIFIAGMFSLVLSQLVIALIGGNVIAGERVERSAEFQVYLPITRKKIFAAKILLAIAIVAVIWLTNLIVMGSMLISLTRFEEMNRQLDLFQPIVNIALTGLTMFCVAWLCSATIKSPTIATFAGLIAPLIIWSILCYIAYLVDSRSNQWPQRTWDILEYSYRGLCLTISPICFCIGTWLYLRRVEP